MNHLHMGHLPRARDGNKAMARALLCALALVACACGDDGDGDPNDGIDSGIDSSADSSIGPGADSAPIGDCDQQIDALAAELIQQPEACSVVVRLDYQTRSIVGYHALCGPYTGLDEAQARATAQTDSGHGASGVMLNPVNPEDAYVFFESPGDFGGASAVSSRTGQTLFGGSIVWDGIGDITYPLNWRPAGDLGSGCDPAGGIASARGYDLILGEPLGAPDVDAAVAVVAQTAVPAALWRGGYVFDAVVLAYPRTVGVFDPGQAEWIVMVNGGWLE